MGEEGDRVAMRFARGCRAFAATLGSAVVSYGWLSTSAEWIGELGVEITPGEGEAYVWNCYTLPEHRRRGHYRRVLEGIVATARAERLRRLWIGSVDVPAEKADADTGFVRVLRFDVSREGEGEVRRLTVTAAPGAEHGLVDEARRRLGLAGWAHTGASAARKH